MPDDLPVTMPDEPRTPLRIGVRRAPGASSDAAVATMEARIVRCELERRLGALSFDLRTEGEPVGPWLPWRHATWSTAVDATVELGELGDLADQLVSLFGRTVDPVAAEVRERMLEHLAILPIGDEPLTDERLAELLPRPARPTDVWLVVRSATTLATSEPAHRSLRVDADAEIVARIDRWLDAAAASVPDDAHGDTVTRLLNEVAELRGRLAQTADDVRRAERTALDRLADVTAERDILRERLDRTELDRPASPEPNSIGPL